MAIKNETRILKTNTFEQWRQKDNEISLRVGDVHDFNSLIADKEYSTTASAGDYVFAGTRFELSNENVLDNPNGYYIGTGRNALNAGPITLGSTMTLDGAWVIV